MRPKLNVDAPVGDVVAILAEGNPGALRVLMELLELPGGIGFMNLLDLEDMNIRGPQIWVGFNDYCKQDLAVFVKCLDDRDRAFVATTDPGQTEKAVTGGAS